MATPIKRIEKEYYLKAVFDNKLPLKCYYERAEYVFTLEKITKDEMWFHMNRPIGQLKPKDNLDFMFEYQGHKIFFTVGIRSVKDTYLVSGLPEPESLFFTDPYTQRTPGTVELSGGSVLSFLSPNRDS